MCRRHFGRQAAIDFAGSEGRDILKESDEVYSNIIHTSVLFGFFVVTLLLVQKSNQKRTAKSKRTWRASRAQDKRRQRLKESYSIMADTKAQIEAEAWIREVYLPKKYGQSFRQKNLALQSRTQFTFDAVSDDCEIVALICISAGFDSCGKVDTDELMKVRSDALRLLMLEARPQKRLMIFTDQSMIDLVKDEKKKGLFPTELEILKVKLPPDLAARVAESQGLASEEA